MNVGTKHTLPVDIAELKFARAESVSGSGGLFDALKVVDCSGVELSVVCEKGIAAAEVLLLSSEVSLEPESAVTCEV